MREVYLIGMGPGNSQCLTGEGRQAIGQAQLLIGAGRMLKIAAELEEAKDKAFFESCRKEEILAFLRAHPEHQKTAVLFSGDIGFYSGAEGLSELLQEEEVIVHRVPGIPSPVYFLGRLGIAWEDVLLVSCHGRKLPLANLILHNASVCCLLGAPEEVAAVCRRLTEFGFGDVRVAVGERLSYPEENIVQGKAADFTERRFEALSIAYFQNDREKLFLSEAETGLEPGAREKTDLCAESEESAETRAQVRSEAGGELERQVGLEADSGKRLIRPGMSIPDSFFLRGKAPMTKEEIRTLAVAKLGLEKDSVVYDIGCGTGSVTVQMALQCPEGTVYGIERFPEGADLTRRNAVRFRCANIEVIEAAAPECLGNLPAPTHVFIGGSGRELPEIVKTVLGKNPEVRLVITSVTLETLSELQMLEQKFPQLGRMEMIQTWVARKKELGSYQMLQGENPVLITVWGGKN